MVDPRPDLKDDSALWTRLLNLAVSRDKLCAGILHGFRCGGLRIKKEPRGYALRPEYGNPESSHWANEQEYAADRLKWLWPCTGMIIDLLNELGRAA